MPKRRPDPLIAIMEFALKGRLARRSKCQSRLPIPGGQSDPYRDHSGAVACCLFRVALHTNRVGRSDRTRRAL